MGQKINPRGFRIGLSDLWHDEGQCYGKGFRNQKNLLKETRNISEFLNQYFDSKKLIQGQTNKKEFNKLKKYNIQYVPTLPKVTSLTHNMATKTAYVFKKNIQVRNYNTTFWYQNGPLLGEFIKTSLKRGIAFRKIINTVQRFLDPKTPHQIVLKTLSGTKVMEYTGLKVRYIGRFGGNRSRMASSIVYRIGAVSLQKIETHIQFYTSSLHTKQGLCNIKVWMAYKVI